MKKKKTSEREKKRRLKFLASSCFEKRGRSFRFSFSLRSSFSFLLMGSSIIR